MPRSPGFAGAIGASRQEQISEQALSLEQAAAIARAWSLVHGFTMLLLDGRLVRHPAAAAEGHHGGDAAGCDAAGDGRPAAGGVSAQRLSALSSVSCAIASVNGIHFAGNIARGDFVHESICRTARLEWLPHPDYATG